VASQPWLIFPGREIVDYFFLPTHLHSFSFGAIEVLLQLINRKGMRE